MRRTSFSSFPSRRASSVFVDSCLGEGLEHGQLGGHIGAHRHWNHAAPQRPGLGQRQATRDIAQERQAERLLGHFAGVVQVVPLRDSLGHVGEAHHEACLVARLNHRGKCERLRRHRWSSKPSCFLILRAVFGSISRAGTVATLLPTHTMACPPLPRQVSTLNRRPRTFAASRSSAMKRSRFCMTHYRTKLSACQSRLRQLRMPQILRHDSGCGSICSRLRPAAGACRRMGQDRAACASSRREVMTIYTVRLIHLTPFQRSQYSVIPSRATKRGGVRRRPARLEWLQAGA